MRGEGGIEKENATAEADRLLSLLYEELRALARSKMASQPPGHTLQATALVHEAWLRLAAEHHPWRDRKHFFAAASETMRRILVDQARRKNRLKRGSGCVPVNLDEIDLAANAEPEELLRLDEALTRLASEDPVKAELVKLRFFVGLSIAEAAEVLQISGTTAKRHWTFTRAWLLSQLNR
jgi:RNA polymerase sigma factor (TIGR02999 family)